MATWGDFVEVINRTSEPLSVRWDGKDMTIEPNYTEAGELLENVHNMLPRVVVPYAKKQNILMGSENPLDVTDFKSLIAVKPTAAQLKAVKDAKGTRQRARAQARINDISFVKQSECPTRVDLNVLLADDTTVKEIRQGRGKFRVSESSIPQLASGASGMMANEPL